LVLSDHSFLSGFFGVRSAPSENLSPTSIKNNEKSSKNQLPILQVPDSDKLKADKTKDKSKKDLNLKSPDTSFGSMDFDQNDLRRSTPNAEEIESAPKTTNPLMMNFIKNSTEQIGNQKNLEAIREETPEGKNKTSKVSKASKEAKDSKEEKEVKESEEVKESTKKEKKEKKEKKKDKKNDEIALKDDVMKNQDDVRSLEGDSNLFSIEPLSERKDEETEKKKSKKGGKGKNKSKE
jgi:hypothetical protein